MPARRRARPEGPAKVPHAGVADDAAGPRSERTVIFTKTKMCKFHILGMCSKGIECKFAHQKEELNPLPDLSCTKLCKTLISTGSCEDPNCRYAHNKEELRGMPDGPDDHDSLEQVARASQPRAGRPALPPRSAQQRPQQWARPQDGDQQPQQQPRNRIRNMRVAQDIPQHPKQKQQLQHESAAPLPLQQQPQQQIQFQLMQQQQLQQQQQQGPQAQQQQQQQMLWPCMTAMPASSAQLAQAAAMQQLMAGMAAQAASLQWAASQQAATWASSGATASGGCGAGVAVAAAQQRQAPQQDGWLHDALSREGQAAGSKLFVDQRPLPPSASKSVLKAGRKQVRGGGDGASRRRPEDVQAYSVRDYDGEAANPEDSHPQAKDDPGGDAHPAAQMMAHRGLPLTTAPGAAWHDQGFDARNLVVKNTFLDFDLQERRTLGLRSVATASGALDSMG